jgi:hypothetical protein
MAAGFAFKNYTMIPTSNPRYRPYTFVIGSKIYVGGGSSYPTLNGDSGSGASTNRAPGGSCDLWEFDIDTFVWTQKANFPGALTDSSSYRGNYWIFQGVTWDGIGFSYNGKGYVWNPRLRYFQNNNSLYSSWPSPALYEYDPALNTWAMTTYNTGGYWPYEDLNTNSGCVIGDYCYRLSCSGTNTLLDKMHMGTKAITALTPIPSSLDTGGFLKHTMFSLGDKFYVYGGRLYNSTTLRDTRLLEYDTFTGIWSRKADGLVAVTDAVSASSNGKGYIIGGGTLATGAALTTVQRYTQATDAWDYAENLPTARGQGNICVINNDIYVVGGTSYVQNTLGTGYAPLYEIVKYSYWLDAPVLTSTINNSTSVTLTWTAVTDATDYSVLRRLVTDATYTSIAIVTVPTLTYNDTSINLLTSEYEYRIRARKQVS